MKNLALETGQNRLLVLSEPIGRVSVADPRVADLKVITPMQLLLTSRGVGTTDLTLWNKRDEPLVLALQVTRNLERLKAQLADLFPDEKISVSAAGDLIVLSGEVSDVRVPERAAEVAQLHSEKIANLIKVVGNQQVQLEVKFAEVSRSGLRELGINFFHQDAGGRFLGGMVNPGQTPDGFTNVPGTFSGTTPAARRRAAGQRLLAVLLGPADLPVQRDPQHPRAERPGQDAGRADAGRAVRAGSQVPGRRRVPDPDGHLAGRGVGALEEVRHHPRASRRR